MRVSVIICTIRSPESMSVLLECLAAQEHHESEIIVVGGPDPAAEEKFQRSLPDSSPPVRYFPSARGLARARNVGLANATGEIVCFLDDDVQISPQFLARVVSLFSDPRMADVGGITGYDVLNYPATVDLRWKLRRLIGITPTLEPGSCTPLGRSVPFSFFKPFSGVREVQWLPGFCQIFRRSAIAGLRYDEHECTVTGFRGIEVEDRDFSMNVGRNWRLLIVGDLEIAHKRSEEERPAHLPLTWRACYGLGRSFAKRSGSLRDRFTALHVLTGEFLLDVVTAFFRPSPLNWKLPWRRAQAFVAGYLSVRAKS